MLSADRPSPQKLLPHIRMNASPICPNVSTTAPDSAARFLNHRQRARPVIHTRGQVSEARPVLHTGCVPGAGLLESPDQRGPAVIQRLTV